MRVRRISVIGAGSFGAGGEDRWLETEAESLGKLIADKGWELVCGGLGGVMEAACRGAFLAGGSTLGLLPGQDVDSANRWVSIPVATGLGQMRNHLVVLNGVAAVACGGGAGTLSEIGHALKSGRKVVAIGKWSELDGVIPATGAVEAVSKLKIILDGER
ncbi:hypothetical protein [Desulfovibrio oxyclinae]|jgi:hypothetical protein|uniref:SLOG cluster 4 domain-containing protein n=1 Tax=Desulfovibrio oxyclinae TaxID=63560 RepID=UPI0003618E0B|nr:hypothetical protein [Desulfovibrio oxyclinae]